MVDTFAAGYATGRYVGDPLPFLPFFLLWRTQPFAGSLVIFVTWLIHLQKDLLYVGDPGSPTPIPPAVA